MRKVFGLIALVSLAAVTLPASPAVAVCSVFDHRPCAPTVCSVFRRHPCTPEFDPPLGQNLQLTIERAAAAKEPGAQDHDQGGKVNTIREMFDALRGCWVPPMAPAPEGIQMTVLLSFKRNGEMIAPPRVTYTTPNMLSAVKDKYYQAIVAALERCTPIPFTDKMGGAIAGRPIAIRFIDNRILSSESL
jgi:hypothetical protein